MEQKALPVKIELEGLRVMGVGQNTTAAALGLIGGDALVSVAGKMSTSAAAIDDALRGVKAGETVRAHWIRKGALMYADAKAEILGPTGELNSRVVLGAALGAKVRESVGELVERAREGLSGFQGAVLDWSSQAHENGKLERWGGIAFGMVAGLGVAFLGARLLRPRALPATQTVRAIGGPR